VFSARPRMDHALRRALCLGAAVALTALAAAPASAEGIFDAIFGAFTGNSPAPRAHAYADPNTDGRRPQGQHAPITGGGGGQAFCVRTCDGRYFPMQRHAGVTPAQMCGAMCPAAKTKIFSGGEISRAVAPDGSRYADLDNAFAYRKSVVDNCTCNGRDAFGLAPINASSDPTLRQGDIVATSAGLMAYSPAARLPRTGETATNFTPVDNAQISRDLRERLATNVVAKP
jgi:Protein of unknown function (DUF2865)